MAEQIKEQPTNGVGTKLIAVVICLGVFLWVFSMIKGSIDKRGSSDRLTCKIEADELKVGNLITSGTMQGIIYEVDPETGLGKAISVEQPRLKMKWCSDEHVVTNGVGATSKDDGYINSQMLRCGASSDYPADNWCKRGGEEWYLPSITELEAVYNSKSTIDSVLLSLGKKGLSNNYWSSTVMENNQAIKLYRAWVVNMGNGGKTMRLLNSRADVRAIVIVEAK